MSQGQTASVSSGAGSPETYHGHSTKNTYRHIPGHQSMTGAPSFSPLIPGHGAPYHPHFGVQNSQFYPQVPGPAAGFMPVYGNGTNPETNGYFYYGPPSWAMHGPLPSYPHPFNGSPPNTPGQVQSIPYGYPLLQPGNDFLASSVPHTGSSNSQPIAHGNHRLENRRNSWSSSGATDTPNASYPLKTEHSAPIMGDGPDTQPSAADDQGNELGKYVESLLLSGPRVPSPIPGAFMSGAVKTLSQTLENPTHTTNVYIRGLPPDTDDDKLYEMTCRFGNVISHKAIMDTEHGTCKGYGFARYENTREAENCIRGLVSLKYEAGFARESFNARLKTLADPNSTNVYVSNLPRDMNEKDMQDIFEGYVVVSNRILRDSQGQSRGVGFARFESREICNNIIRNFHGYPVGRERLALQVRYADTSAQKRLKATTTKKRQFRANEYNSHINGSYGSQALVPEAAHQHVNTTNPMAHQQSVFGGRIWPRHNSNGTFMHSSPMGEASSSSVLNLQNKSLPRNWDKSQDWAGHNEENRREENRREENRREENRHADWKANNARWLAPGQPDTHLKLETVHENPDDNVSETQSELTTIPHLGRSTSSVGKGSSGSFSDPGDSYGGREYSDVHE